MRNFSPDYNATDFDICYFFFLLHLKTKSNNIFFLLERSAQMYVNSKLHIHSAFSTYRAPNLKKAQLIFLNYEYFHFGKYSSY